jgi:NAD(P)-dependent dehydrogenase (short-subunit alcohol dehydrogenase family)
MSERLDGKIAVVTGASSGLGARFAKILAARGAKVAVLARRTDRLDVLTSEICSTGGMAKAYKLDVAVAAIGPALDQIQEDLGPLSIMINNAGVGGEGLALEITPEQFDQTFAVNVRGVFFGAREAARRMIASGIAEQGLGRIVNIASILAFNQFPGLTTYSATKAAVASLTKGLGREWARTGIAVNAMCPGYIETEINADWFKTEGGAKQIKSWPRRRLMDEDVLDDALFMLCGDRARFITGTTISIDDGQML